MNEIFILILLFPTLCLSRGRYEFIDDADLAAFYSMRSAQLAQQAQQQQFAQTQTSGGAVSPYSPYYHYPYYQASAVPSTEGISLVPAGSYNPYLHYAPFRTAVSSAAAATNPSFIAAPAAQGRAMTAFGQYSPYFTGMQQQLQAKNKKKS